jgi:hypothetical protein
MLLFKVASTQIVPHLLGHLYSVSVTKRTDLEPADKPLYKGGQWNGPGNSQGISGRISQVI